jgi:hypothetical protein
MSISLKLSEQSKFVEHIGIKNILADAEAAREWAQVIGAGISGLGAEVAEEYVTHAPVRPRNSRTGNSTSLERSELRGSREVDVHGIHSHSRGLYALTQLYGQSGTDKAHRHS